MLAPMHKFNMYHNTLCWEVELGVSGIGASWLRSDLLSIFSQFVMAVLSDVTALGQCFCHPDAQADLVCQAFWDAWSF